MDFSANIDFTAEELAAFLEELTLNLRQSRTLELPLGFTHVSMNVGESKISSNIEIIEEDGNNSLTINFKWQEITSVEPEQIVEVAAESAAVVSTSNESAFIDAPSSFATVVSSTGKKKRMALNTSTFSTDVGSYIDTSTEIQGSYWELLIDRDAKPANERWNQETELFDGIPKIPLPSQTRSVSSSTPVKTEKKSKAYLTEIEGAEAPDTSVPAPSISKATRRKPMTSTAPAAPISKAPQPRGRIPETTPVAENEWQEPSRDDISTGDDWVKPSEILKKKQKEPISHVESKPVVPPPKNPGIIEESPGFRPSDIAKLAGTAKNDIPAPVTEDRGRPDVADKNKKKKSGWAKW